MSDRSSPSPASGRPAATAILTLGFGATVAMWTVGYVCRMPPAAVPAPVLLLLMLACLFGAGILAGRHAGAGIGAGAMVGLLSAALNLLILGSVIAGAAPNRIVPSALLWVPGSLLASMVLAALGALGGRIAPGRRLSGAAWRTAFAAVASLATLLAVIAGGLVTSLDAGLAVPDWPNSFGSNMFLYPLARMTGGIYYEHTHRLYGALVGLTTVSLAAVIWVSDRRRWPAVFATAAVLMVVGQGVMGGLRVVETNRALAVVHGVFGQVFFTTMTLIWAFLSRSWREGEERVTATAGTDHRLSAVLLLLVLGQIGLGAMFRHQISAEQPLPWPGMAHMVLAFVVVLFAALVGLRSMLAEPRAPVLRRLGLGLLHVVALQVILGFAALVPIMARREDWRSVEVVLATAHQANGAVLLAFSGQLAVWTKRLRRSGGGGRQGSTGAGGAGGARAETGLRASSTASTA